jgi:hypothetical protein
MVTAKLDPIRSPGQVTHIIACMHAVAKHGRLSIRPEYNHSIGGCMHRWSCGWINGSLDRSTRSNCEVCIAAPTADRVSSPCLRAHIHICMHKKTWMQGGSVVSVHWPALLAVSLDASFSLRMREKERCGGGPLREWEKMDGAYACRCAVAGGGYDGELKVPFKVCSDCPAIHRAISRSMENWRCPPPCITRPADPSKSSPTVFIRRNSEPSTFMYASPHVDLPRKILYHTFS